MTYRALVTMCDYHLGPILDFMDSHNMWDDTLLIVNTDHGLLLGEHGWWAKCRMPFFNEIANTPLFVWDPRFGRKDEHVSQLVQTIDLPPTLLDFFQTPVPDQMQGKSIAAVLKDNSAIREAGIFGIFGGHVNVTDGRYVYMRGPVLRVPGEGVGLAHQFGTMLFDTQTDPKQVHPIKDSEIEARMIELLREQMRLAHAPAEQYERLGL